MYFVNFTLDKNYKVLYKIQSMPLIEQKRKNKAKLNYSLSEFAPLLVSHFL